ncbi:MAG TPA: diacylglycerol kinase family protein [Candidatus Saccharimonadales bacterium]|nr:diacylglycerol kinase family protein [Candidatus Saccharimonadales bacterium]
MNKRPPAELTKAHTFTTVVILHNAKSKQADVALERITTLQRLFPEQGNVEVIESHPDLEITRNTIHTTLITHLAAGREPLFAIAGGDGTVNMALQTIASKSTPSVIQDTILVPLGTGNANDLAHMLYHDPANVKELFLHGKSINIQPLEFLVIPAGKNPADPAVMRIAERHIASNYISLGASAQGARTLNKKSVRKQAKGEGGTGWLHKLGHKLYGQHVPDFLAFRAALQAPAFSIMLQGREIQIREILFGNGDRAAKLGRMPARLDKPELYTTMVRHHRFSSIALLVGAVQMFFGKLPGQVLNNPTYTFTVLEDVPVQYDGETSVIRAGSTVIISHADQAFRTLTTKLQA